MNFVYILFAVVVISFGIVIAFGAPYLPTLKKQTDTALNLLNLKPGQTLLELGCGDGRVAKAAAKRGLKCVAYELNPILVIIARLSTVKYRKNVKIIWGDFWTKDWPEPDGIFVFLLEKYMDKLDKKIVQSKFRNVKLVSFAFEISNKEPLMKEDGVFLYEYR